MGVTPRRVPFGTHSRPFAGLALAALACATPQRAETPRPHPLEPLTAAPWASLEAHFRGTEGWIGGDGAHSVALDRERTLWLFSDTWVGSIRDGARHDARIVNNTVAVQRGHGSEARVEFFVRRDARDVPTAFVTPPHGRGWFWMQAGVRAGSRLLLFLPNIERTEDPGVFGFRSIGLWLGVVDDPHGDPLAWRIRLSEFPHTEFSAEREITFGCAALAHDGFVYAYGTEDVLGPLRARHLVLARAPSEHATDPTAWRFFSDGQWQHDVRRCSRIFPNMGAEASVLHQPERGRFVIVCTELGLSERILARSSSTPWGPWSEPMLLARCPEPATDARLFTYAAKAHASWSTNDELAVSYVVNSTDFWQVARDAELYWPRFLRVKLRSP